MKLENDLIRLIPYDEEHIDFFAKWRRYYGDNFFTSVFPSISALHKGLIGYIDKSMSGKVFWWVITKTEDTTDSPIGMIGLNDIDYKNGSAELGQMFILEQHRGQGYMPKAINMVLDLAFLELRLESVCLWTYPFNKDAIKMYTSAGFTASGAKRRAFFRKGTHWDLLLMDRLKDEHLTEGGGE